MLGFTINRAVVAKRLNAPSREARSYRGTMTAEDVAKLKAEPLPCKVEDTSLNGAKSWFDQIDAATRR